MRDNDNDTWYENLFKNLDQRCHNCRGDGVYFDALPSQQRDCDVCYGTGYQPTRAGVELLNFLRRQRKRIERERV